MYKKYFINNNFILNHIKIKSIYILIKKMLNISIFKMFMWERGKKMGWSLRTL